jgi:DNA excision repair protein ERCC-1
MLGKETVDGRDSQRIPVLGAGGRPEQAANRDRNGQHPDDVGEEDEDAMIAAAIEASKQTAGIADPPPSPRQRSEELGDGIAAALARLREKG